MHGCRADCNTIELLSDGESNNKYTILFCRFYWFINVGALIATSAVAYVQQNLGFDYGFMIPFITMIFSLGFLVLGKNRFGHRPPEGNWLFGFGAINNHPN